MSDSSIVILVALAIAGILGVPAYLIKNKWDKEFTEERKNREKQMVEANALWDLRFFVHQTFGIELDTIHERTTQDEIVRVVNLLALQTAKACVIQDKKTRCGQDGSGKRADKATSLKITWSQTRNIALRAVPNLKDRMPHFSEFEPLKSYREEHIKAKETKRRASQQSEG